jgi:hypothetical protein
MRKLTQQEFIDRAQSLYSGAHEYPIGISIYNGSTEPFTAKCKIHGLFTQLAQIYITGYNIETIWETDWRKQSK